jgi:hypothetical protein
LVNCSAHADNPLAVILAAMLVQMAMSLTAPRPLKAILDNVARSHPPPQ